MLGELHMPESLSPRPSAALHERSRAVKHWQGDKTEVATQGKIRGQAWCRSLVGLVLELAGSEKHGPGENSLDKECLCENTEGFLTPLNPSLVSSAVRLTRSTCDCLFSCAGGARMLHRGGGAEGGFTGQHLPD